MKKIKITLVLLAGMTLSFSSFAQNSKTIASVDFKIRNLGINVDGRFKQSTITTNFTSPDHTQWSLSGSVETKSIDTDNNKRDKHLKEEDYFDVDAFPKITLKATNFKKVSAQKYDVTAKLTIKETTKTITIPMEIIGDANSFKLRSNFEINRRDYGVGGSSLILSNTVKISVYYVLNN
ncbi:YceI family protein [uncultured Psychroserpens sp.]|uniref:YceI family protein n=1 Tax=uncultured Psychroserpens sp. TaxID=255436 RepID=UPI002637D613|nr:YceI family protein [uncultured Psychroserpens sp.]